MENNQAYASGCKSEVPSKVATFIVGLLADSYGFIPLENPEGTPFKLNPLAAEQMALGIDAAMEPERKAADAMQKYLFTCCIDTHAIILAEAYVKARCKND